MDVHFNCQSCHQQLVADTSLGGLKIGCPRCGQQMVVPFVTEVPTEIRVQRTAPPVRAINLPHPPADAARHTLGDALPHTTEAPLPSAAEIESKALITTMAALVAIGLVVVALFNMERIGSWFGSKPPAPAVANTQADEAFLKTACEIAGRYHPAGAVQVHNGTAQLQLDIPAATAQQLAEALAVRYALARTEQGLPDTTTITINHAGGESAVAVATARSALVDLPPAPAPVVSIPAPRFQAAATTVLATPPPPDAPVTEPYSTALADSARDFSDRQGQAHWQYGSYRDPFTSDTFAELPAYTNNAWREADISISRQDCVASPELWPVRRWTSPTNATVDIRGRFTTTNAGEEWTVMARIQVDGRVVFARPLAGEEKPTTCSVRTTVQAGSVVDFMIENNSTSEIPTVHALLQIDVAPPASVTAPAP